MDYGVVKMYINDFFIGEMSVQGINIGVVLEEVIWQFVDKKFGYLVLVIIDGEDYEKGWQE